MGAGEVIDDEAADDVRELAALRADYQLLRGIYDDLAGEAFELREELTKARDDLRAVLERYIVPVLGSTVCYSTRGRSIGMHATPEAAGAALVAKCRAKAERAAERGV